MVRINGNNKVWTWGGYRTDAEKQFQFVPTQLTLFKDQGYKVHSLASAKGFTAAYVTEILMDNSEDQVE
jgi:hypothetical protein